MNATPIQFSVDDLNAIAAPDDDLAVEQAAMGRPCKHTCTWYQESNSNAPKWCRWHSTYAAVATVLITAEARGFFQLRDRDRNLCNQIESERRITEKQRRWLGFLSGKHLQDGVYEGSTWWSRVPEKNLVSRWTKILATVSNPSATVQDIEEATGSEFMAKYQKILASKA